MRRDGPLTVLPGVAPVLRDLMARRLARSWISHLTVSLLALLELLLIPGSGWGRTLALVGGAGLSAAALLTVGWAGVRRGAGQADAGWMRWAGPAAVVSWAFGVCVFGIAGLRGLATAAGSLPRLLAGAAYVVLGLRLLREVVRVREVGRLGRFMALPAPEETGS